MDAKTVLITGANSGIGHEVARALAQRGAQLLLVCRDEARGRHAQHAIAQVASGPKPLLFIADLSSQQEIRQLVTEVRRTHAGIDVLVNNAGGVFAPRQLSVDGIEMTFATNYLAPFLLTNLLLDLVMAAPGGRIVNVVTEVYPGKLKFGDLQLVQGYNFFYAYMHSKLAEIVFTNELARRLQDTGTTANSISPGPTVTNFGASGLRGLPALMPKIMMRMPFFASAECSARSIVRLASSVEMAGVSGRFFLREKELHAKPIANDRAVAQRLWQISEELTGLNKTIREAAS